VIQRDSIWKRLAIVFAVVLGVYILGFTWVEHQRERRGPWEVTFLGTTSGLPAVRIDQPALGIHDVRINLETSTRIGPMEQTVQFLPGQTVPFEVPFGECLFMDPLFLPGTVTLDLFEHRVELLPRALIINGQEHSWTAGQRLRAAQADADTSARGTPGAPREAAAEFNK
jgi:hypothetical protein